MDTAKGIRFATGASLAMAILQSICTAVFTISSVRLAIGLGSLVLAGTVFYTPIRWIHQDPIRVPMLILAAVGALVDLGVLVWRHRLRAQPSAQWRKTDKSPKQKRSERLQIAFSILTLLLVGTEQWLHAEVFHPSHPRATVNVSAPPKA